jgi:hypothetical protein
VIFSLLHVSLVSLGNMGLSYLYVCGQTTFIRAHIAGDSRAGPVRWCWPYTISGFGELRRQRRYVEVICQIATMDACNVGGDEGTNALPVLGIVTIGFPATMQKPMNRRE